MTVQVQHTVGSYFQAVSHNTVRRGQAKYALKMLVRHREALAESEALKVARASGLITRAEYERKHPPVFAAIRATSRQAVFRHTGLDPVSARRVYENPWLYSPIVDRIAIRRALVGDGSVLPGMTVFEREILYRKLREIHLESVGKAVQLDDDGNPIPSRLTWLERELGIKGLAEAIGASHRRAAQRQAA